VSAGAAFQGLGDLPGGAVYSVATGVCADGSVVVGYSSARPGSPQHPERVEPTAIRWTSSGGLRAIVAAGGGDTQALGVAAAGQWVAGGYAAAGRPLAACLFGEDGGVSPLEPTARPYVSLATGVSAAGDVAVGYSQGDEANAFRWTAGDGLRALDLPGPGLAYGVSDDGAVVVGAGAGPAGVQQAFVWTPGRGESWLPALPGGRHSAALAVSRDGTAVVGVSESHEGPQAFLWREDGLLGLGDLPGGVFDSRATSVSAGGATVVGESRGQGDLREAFVWTARDGIRPLGEVLAAAGVDLTGWKLTTAAAVSADGRVVAGTGTNPRGEVEAWRAVLAAPR
jgi:probable HAF family extracellular repeat protein